MPARGLFLRDFIDITNSAQPIDGFALALTQRCHDADGDGWIVLYELQKIVAAQAQHRDAIQGAGSGGARPAVEQRYFSEEIARAECREGDFPTGLVREGDIHPTLLDDVNLVSRVADPE